ncbi:MAG: hypothetical protein ABSG45_10105 [Nitrososphaerales archaeon]|jgi:hypothetical protein
MSRSTKRTIAVLVLALLVVAGVAGVSFAAFPTTFKNLVFSAPGGYADVQTFDLNPLSDFSITVTGYTAYNVGNSPVLFSIQAPDGSFLLKDVPLGSYSYSFIAEQSGAYRLNFSMPNPSLGYSAAANITIRSPFAGQYGGSGGNQVVLLQ